MAKKRKGERVFDFLGSLPLWTRRSDAQEKDALRTERRRLASIQSQLLDILNSETLISAGRVQILGLDGLKQRLGSRWEAHRDAVHNSLKTIVQRKLSAKDVFFQYGEDEYVVVFASLSFAAAKLVCAGILREVSELLLGDECNQSITVRTAVGVVDGRLLTEESSIDDVLASFSHAEATSAEIDPKDDEMPIAPPRFAEDSADHSQLGWQPIEFDSKLGGKVPTAWVPIDDEAADRNVSLDEFQLIYRPMWSPSLQAVTTFSANFVSGMKDGRPMNAYALARGSKLVRRMDASVLMRTSYKVAELFSGPQRFLMAVPHHYEFVASWSRLQEYADYCRSVPDDVQRYLALSCDDFPAGVPASKLLMIGNALAPYCRHLAANVSWTARDLGPYRDAGFSVVALFVPKDLPQSLVKARIEDFTEMSRRLGLRTAVLNVHDVDLGEVVRNAGVDFVMGRLIGDYQSAPSSMVRLSWDEIKAGLRVGGAPDLPAT